MRKQASNLSRDFATRVSAALCSVSGLEWVVKLHLEGIIVMKMRKVGIAALFGMSFVSGAWGAQNNATPAQAAVATPTEYYGTIEVTLEITAKSTIASSTPVYCTVSLNVGAYEGGAGKIDAASESEAVPTTLSGGKATCVVKVPYFWYIETPAETLVNMTVAVVAGSNATLGTTLGRTSTRDIGGFPIPSPGATTSFAYSIYL